MEEKVKIPSDRRPFLKRRFAKNPFSEMGQCLSVETNVVQPKQRTSSKEDGNFIGKKRKRDLIGVTDAVEAVKKRRAAKKAQKEAVGKTFNVSLSD